MELYKNLKNLEIFMKKILLLAFVLIFSCENMTEKQDIQKRQFLLRDSEGYKKSRMREADFWEKSELPKLIKEGKIGNSPENAVVPLLYNEEENLMTVNEFDKNLALGKVNTPNFTSLISFRKVTNEETATIERVKLVELIDEETGQAFYVYDPFEKDLDEVPDVPMSLKKGGSYLDMPDVNIADILVGWRENGQIFGHAGIVVKVNNSYSMDGGDPKNEYTKTMEAQGKGKGGRGYDGFSEEDQVAEIPVREYWMDSDIKEVYLRRGNKPLSSRISAASYARAQDPDLYSIWTSKRTENKWYCSKLVYAAYRNTMGINLDPNGGFWVTPADIKNDRSISTIWSWRK
jgi:hypothetical protein